MPMTPWHLGPGLAFKAVAGPRMSPLTFAAAQGLMDVQVVYRILNQIPNPHGWTHTLVGSLAVAAVAACVTVPIARAAERIISRDGGAARPWMTWRAGWCAALIGAVSHVVLDSIMHTDLRPFWPLVDASPIHRVMSLQALHDLCFWLGAGGCVAWVVTAVWRRRAQKEAPHEHAGLRD